ncbi:MAG: hypothetical protein ACPGC0_04570, partial [Opitutales bacterium]
MEQLIEFLQNRDWLTWGGLVLVALLLLVFCIKFIIKLGKLFFILLVVGGLGYGLALLFPEQAAPVLEQLREFLPGMEEP